MKFIDFFCGIGTIRMGIDDVITDKVIQAGISDTQMYRTTGDACTVNVIYEIAKRLS